MPILPLDHHLDLALSEDSEVTRIPNTPAGVRSLVRALRDDPPRLIVIESTGGYERRALDALAKAQIPVSLVNPWRVRRFGEGLGQLAKTDPIDAHLLAIFGDKANPSPTAVASPEDRKLVRYTQRRRQFIDMIVAEKTGSKQTIRRKLLTILNAMVRDQKPREPRTA